MIRTYVLPLIALFGLLFAVTTVVRGGKPAPVAAPIAEPAKAPFESFVAGAGIVEAASENISVGTAVAGVVANVAVKVGDRVREGDELFRIDVREVEARLRVAEANQASAEAELARLIAQPRAEDIPAAEAAVAERQSAAASAEADWKRALSVPDKRAISAEEIANRRFAADGAKARLAQARADLARLKAGAWAPDLEITKAAVEVARAEVARARTDIERSTVRALIAGQVLQIKTRVGEFAQAGASASPLLLLGSLERPHIRVDVDENDAWRFEPGARAIAFVRGNPALETTLRFEHVEPYVVPKVSLTGASSERVDTRVLQVIYSFDEASLPVYVGQQMDVFMEAAPVPDPSPAAGGAPGAVKS